MYSRQQTEIEPGELPESRTLAAPAGGWGKLAGLFFDEDVLYVLSEIKKQIREDGA